MEFAATHRRAKGKLTLVVGAALIVIFAAVAGFFFWQWQSLKSDPKVAAEESSQRILRKVGAIYALPTGEEPTVALVQDKDKLKGQSFFDKAQNGDYLLMYSKAKVALIYREKDGKLINVGPISLDDSKNADNGEEQPSGTVAPAATEQEPDRTP